ncbi:MAG: hypothetical protein M3680_10910 [Myxococcota bacterium]|nr:hypothetical protein [Myxococcota bacterium]
MSKIKALITTLVLGSSSAAIAAPSISFDASARASWGTPTTSAPIVRDHHRTDLTIPRGRGHAWIALTEPLTSARRNIIDIGMRRDHFAQLRLQTVAGSTYVYALRIRFDDGTRETVTVNRWLSSGMPSLQVPLPQGRRGIDKIVVTSYAGRGAAFQVFGLRTRFAEQPPIAQPVPPIYQPPVYQPPYAQPPVAQPPVYQPPVYQAPVSGLTVARDLSFANTGGSRAISVGAELGTFTKLRVEATSGHFPITAVQIDFVNGTSQVIANVNQLLRIGESVDFQLAGGPQGIRQILIKTTPNRPPVQQASRFNVVLL